MDLIPLLWPFSCYKISEIYKKLFSESIRIDTSHGPIIGYTISTYFNYKYHCFLGVPYGKSPIGDLRFMDPQPIDVWTEPLSAFTENIASQSNFFFKTPCGTEDCLRMNIYTKYANELNKNLPVLVYFHGGAFMYGSNTKDVFNPEFLLRRDVVVFVVNYRLGAFGFLSLNDQRLNVPGNAGLKDQVLALKWIKNNASFFGGNSNNITIFGESAGGCSVHFHMLSKMSKDLFHKAISMSGTALNNWSINKNRNWPERLAKQLGWNGDVDSTTDANVLDYLRNVSAENILKAQDKLLTADERKQFILFPFGPVTEPYISEQCFIPKEPKLMCRDAWSHQIPFIVGGCSEEGLLLYRVIMKKSYLLSKLAGFEIIVPIELELDLKSDKCKEIGQKIKQYYFGKNEPSIETVFTYIKLLTDKIFWHGISRTVMSRLTYPNSGPTYLYRFNFDSKYFNHAKLFFAGRNISGACHSDDCSYIFKNALSGRINENTKEFQTMEQMVDFWTTFAATGNPNNSSENLWEPVQSTKPYKCMNIGDDINCIELPESDRMDFWDSLYTGITELI